MNKNDPFEAAGAWLQQAARFSPEDATRDDVRVHLARGRALLRALETIVRSGSLPRVPETIEQRARRAGKLAQDVHGTIDQLEYIFKLGQHAPEVTSAAELNQSPGCLALLLRIFGIN